MSALHLSRQIGAMHSYERHARRWDIGANALTRRTGRTPRELADDRAYLLARFKLIANENRGGSECLWYRGVARKAVEKVEGRP
jgi:hypothetical protein